MDQFLWVIFPYLMVTIFIVGHIYRYKTEQLEWTAKSSEFFEKGSLKWGSMLFHIGVILVFFGHVVGLLIPKGVFERIGINEHFYHAGAVYGGGAAGLITLAGILILFSRRIASTRVRVISEFSDYLVTGLLLLIIALGVYNTLGYNLFVGHFDYRETIGPWVRGFLMLNPDPSLMLEVPLFFKLHILLSFTLFGIWPFTRLVHVWSVPLVYFRRSYILYRRRNVRQSVS
ncbi:respiratory nitrate reductase subunit gamma [Calidifontibacillus erzurumensis]|uniref:Respiratory nitrate reductase subunit gamma n=1 Tax=Calidifontibacillus erzurumensis TaxID=2741433 RepID=A0A8J8GFE0_9BACI|nr:respiratory nitrate reductase subunit gamma [Calidifontibacillus erzurumensis]NSL52637.1 respiratory nitrate reductase subunit gamma [Calidifontibacillus erzurumensis]